MFFPRAVEAGEDLRITDLPKVVVATPDRAERLGAGHTHQIVCDRWEPSFPAERGYRHGEHHVLGVVGPRDLAGRLGGRASGETVVDDDRCPSRQSNG